MAENIPFNARAGKKLLKICMGDIYPNPMVVYSNSSLKFEYMAGSLRLRSHILKF